jgi:hypothetical protein
MKRFRIFFIISCFVMAVYFLISGISIAEQTSVKKCISKCAQKRQVCFNINTDKRQCEVEFQSCVAACNSESDSPSSTPPGSNKTLKPM